MSGKPAPDFDGGVDPMVPLVLSGGSGPGGRGSGKPVPPGLFGPFCRCRSFSCGSSGRWCGRRCCITCLVTSEKLADITATSPTVRCRPSIVRHING